MRRIALLSVFFLSVVGARFAFAFDWVKLHGDADKITVAQAEQRVQQKPDSAQDWYVLGLVYLNLHKDPEAGEAFRKVLALEPDSVEAKWGQAEVLRRQHDLKKAEVMLKEVMKEKAGFSPAYNTLAYINYTQMNFNQAVRLAGFVMAQRDAEVDVSNQVRAYLMYSGAKGMIAHYGGPLSKLLNGTAVFSNIKKAQSLQPDSAGVFFGLGSYYLLAPSLVGGDLQQAERYLKKAVEADPLFADAYVRLGQLYKLKGNDAEYWRYIQKALEIDPRNELALDIQSGACKFICIGK